MQGRIAASEIIHLNLEAQLPQLFCVGDQKLRVFRKCGFRDFDPKLIGRDAILPDQAAELAGNVPVLPDVTARHIHRNRTVKTLPVPSVQVLTDLVPHKAIQFINESGFLQHRNKIRRIQKTQLIVVPAAKRLCPCDLSCIIIHLGLIPDMKAAGSDRGRQMIDHFSNLFSFFPLFRVIKPIAFILRIPYFSLRHMGTVHHMVYINLPAVCRSNHIEAAAQKNPILPAPIHEIGSYRTEQLLIVLPQGFISPVAAKNCKPIRRNAPHSFFL